MQSSPPSQLVFDGRSLAYRTPAATESRSRRCGRGTRRVELEIGGETARVEIDLPFDHPAGEKTRIAFKPKRWKLFALKD